MLRLREGPLLYCSFTEQWRDWKQRKGLAFKTTGGREFTGYGMFAALSFDDGVTWPLRRLITDGLPERTLETTNGKPGTGLFIMDITERRVQKKPGRWAKKLP